MHALRFASRASLIGAPAIASAIAVALLANLGCSSDSDSADAGDDGGFAPLCPSGSCDAATGVNEPTGDGTSFTESIGPGGGTVTFEQVALSIPTGALANDVSITVTASPESAPDGVTNLSPVYTFSPIGTKFALPVSLTITFEVGGANPICVISTNANKTGYTAVATSIDPTTSTATCPLPKLADAFVANSATLGSIPTAVTTGDDAGTSDAAVASDAASSTDAH